MKTTKQIQPSRAQKLKQVVESFGILALFLWIAGILFPFEWPARLSTTYRAAFNSVFFAPWTHEPTHFALFFVLGCLLAWLLLRTSSRRVRRYAGAIFALTVVGVACCQEGFQLAYLNRLPGSPEILDVSVDMAGAAVGALVLWLWKHKRPTEIRFG
jgi:glycopeptide antibiotics resistance protein